MPSASRPSAVQTVTSLTSRVLAEPSGCLPCATLELGGAHRDAGAVHAQVHRRRGGRLGLDDVALVPGDLASQRLGRALDLLGVDRDAGQLVQQLAASSKLTIAADRPTMRVTAGDSEAPSSPSARSRGKKPLLHASQW